MEFLKKKHVGQQWYHDQLYGSPLNIMYILRYAESLNAGEHDFNPCWILKCYINVNINLF